MFVYFFLWPKRVLFQVTVYKLQTSTMSTNVTHTCNDSKDQDMVQVMALLDHSCSGCLEVYEGIERAIERLQELHPERFSVTADAAQGQAGQRRFQEAYRKFLIRKIRSQTVNLDSPPQEVTVSLPRNNPFRSVAMPPQQETTASRPESGLGSVSQGPANLTSTASRQQGADVKADLTSTASRQQGANIEANQAGTASRQQGASFAEVVRRPVRERLGSRTEQPSTRGGFRGGRGYKRSSSDRGAAMPKPVRARREADPAVDAIQINSKHIHEGHRDICLVCDQKVSGNMMVHAVTSNHLPPCVNPRACLECDGLQFSSKKAFLEHMENERHPDQTDKVRARLVSYLTGCSYKLNLGGSLSRLVDFLRHKGMNWFTRGGRNKAVWPTADEDIMKISEVLNATDRGAKAAELKLPAEPCDMFVRANELFKQYGSPRTPEKFYLNAWQCAMLSSDQSLLLISRVVRINWGTDREHMLRQQREHEQFLQQLQQRVGQQPEAQPQQQQQQQAAAADTAADAVAVDAAADGASDAVAAVTASATASATQPPAVMQDVVEPVASTSGTQQPIEADAVGTMDYESFSEDGEDQDELDLNVDPKEEAHLLDDPIPAAELPVPMEPSL